MAKVLLVEDNQDLANLVRSLLEFEDHTVHVFHTGGEGRDSILKNPYDLVILDWDLPEVSGIEILKEFRSQGGNTPVLMLTGRQSSEEKEEGLDGGADDYLTKPFDMKELGARVRAQLRRAAKSAAPTTLQLADIIIDTAKQRATRAGRTVVLTSREYSLLEFCAKYPHLSPNMPALMEQVWNSDPEVTEEVASNTIRRLRKKLDPEVKIICPHLAAQSSASGSAGPHDLPVSSQSVDENLLDDETDPFIGTVFDDKYELLSLLGGGGTGVVYRAKHCVIGNIVAVKLLYPHLSLRSDVVKRFSQEARSAGILSHKNVIVIHDFGQNDLGQPYLVMELIDGISLDKLLKQSGRFSLQFVGNVFVQACEGVAHAHHKGVLHRDIKPSNILLMKDESGAYKVKLVDFGLAKPTNSEELESITQTGQVFGSPPYMAPEQCRGRGVDRRSDIYSLGCVLFELLTGAPPFVGYNAIQTIMHHVNSPPPHLVREDLPGETVAKLDAVIQTCLAKAQDDRFQSVNELIKEFKKCL